ncbi:MAG: glutamine-hydrolyzing carbamoyl-phosphate synthase small subunit [Clostridiales bacterium]|jgi:carbamoyl-phosphate synthase small subunit|nr:glutamine-hydrolyzing carbamoyl-phosphate synthase small subunit [Clostridiales bacterium]
MTARLVLENGTVFEGSAFGHLANTAGEVVFTTGMTGYQETLTDPSFAGQIVTMTYPLIGNYGINLDDMESASPKLRGFIVREKCDAPSNWRCEMDLDGFLRLHRVIGLEGVDTRKLTKILRTQGSMRAELIVSAEKPIPDYSEADRNLVKSVTCAETYTVPNPGGHYNVAVMDFGAKSNILRELHDNGCELTVFPAFTPAPEVLRHNPDAVFLTNGPGDPKDIPEAVENVKRLCEVIPVLGICLGHQLIGLACGCDTAKLKFGHHGGNHPVKDLCTGRVYITSQNHNYVVSRLNENIEVTHVNVNDGTVEGIRHKTKPVMSVQFHPEASPGPVDTRFLFADFLNAVKR